MMTRGWRFLFLDHRISAGFCSWVSQINSNLVHANGFILHFVAVFRFNFTILPFFPRNFLILYRCFWFYLLRGVWITEAGGVKGRGTCEGFFFFCTQIRRAIIELIDSQDLILYVTHATDLTRNDLYRQQKGWLSSSPTNTCNWWLHITQLRHVIATSTSLVFENLHPLESKIILQSVGETFSLSYFVADLKCTLPRPW